MDLKCCFNDCSVKIKTVKEYRLHFRVNHSLITLGSYECTFPNCQKKFMKTKGLLDHLYRLHKLTKSGEHEQNAVNQDQLSEIYDSTNDFRSQSTIEVSENSQRSIENSSQTNVVEENAFEKIFLNFLMNLHAKGNLTKEIIKYIFESLKEDVIDKICLVAGVEEKTQLDIEEAYRKMNTQYKFEKTLKENNFMTSGINETISSKIGNIFKNGISIVDEIKETICIMPIKEMIKKIFSIPNILKTVLCNMEKLQNNECLRNVINGERWKSIIENYPENSIIIPFDLYTDDFETGNALGSNSGAHKIAGYYISFPTFPSHLVLSTKYIFEALLYETKLKRSDMKPCLAKLAQIFKDLESEGLDLLIEGRKTKVYFIMTRIIGDNLGLNEILGFTTSFNANKFCRLCNLSKTQTRNNIHPKLEDLRKPDQYENDKQTGDISSTGIIDDCVFNTLENFHCTQNFVCDLMHDIYEGVAKYDIPLILQKFVNDKSIDLDLDAINNLKQNFSYGHIEIGNLSNEITLNNLKKFNLKMSASEIKTFLHFIPLMIGQYIQSDNEYYKMLLNLLDISDLIMASCFDSQSLIKLKKLVESYTTTYVKLFGPNLKPKHHFLTHYANCIEYCGPLRFMMTFGYETKNKDVKTYANVSNQRINLAYSLSTKAAMRFNEFIRTHQNGFPKDTSHTNAIRIKWNSFKKQHPHNFMQDFKINDQFIYTMRAIIHKKTTYKIDDFIVENIECPKKLMKINKIFLIDNLYYFIVELFAIEHFDTHFRSYKAGEKTNTFELVEVQHLASLPFNLHKLSNGNIYFRIKNI